MLVGGEDLTKVSTQALKQHYEKTIEEATPAKQIKVIMSSVCLNNSLDLFYEVSMCRFKMCTLRFHIK